jgi:SRSO17 transposase
MRGLLADLPRKNCWTIGEHAGDPSPDGMQHLLSQAVWDADAVRDDVRDYVIDHLADAEVVLVIDEVGDLKKGTATVGVQHQYTGTAGKIDNAQVAVYLSTLLLPGTRSSTVSCICRGDGSLTLTAALLPGA